MGHIIPRRKEHLKIVPVAQGGLDSLASPTGGNRKPSAILGENIYWDLGKVPNPHMVILGTSGSGKTQTLKAIAGELFRSFPSQSIVLDFHGDQQLPGETYYPLNMASDYGINPLTINLDPEGGGSKL